MSKPWHRDVPARVTEYLANGGLVNPELMNHEAVRALLIDARDVIEIIARKRPTPETEVRSGLAHQIATAKEHLAETPAYVRGTTEMRLCRKCQAPLPEHWSFSFCNVCRDQV